MPIIADTATITKNGKPVERKTITQAEIIARIAKAKVSKFPIVNGTHWENV